MSDEQPATPDVVPVQKDNALAEAFPIENTVDDMHAFPPPVDPNKHYPTGSWDDSQPVYPERPHFHQHHLGMKPATQLITFDGCANDPYHPSAMPLYQTATFVQPSSSEFGSYDYTRSGNPTRTALETLVAGLENAHSSFAFNSGMAALNCVARLAQNGQEIIASSDLYGGMYRLLTRVSARGGVSIKFVDTSSLEEVRKALSAKTALVHLETPSNPLMRISDLRRIASMVHDTCPGCVVSVDSTMMSPYLQKPLTLGVDIVVHSATKFLSGHADTMGGMVCVANQELADQVAFFQNAEGTALAPFDCWMFLRSIKTLSIRVERAMYNAEQVAAFLCRHPAILRLHYAGPIPNPKRMSPVEWKQGRVSNPWYITPRPPHVVNLSSSRRAHELHMTQSRGGGSVLSFQTGNVAFSRRFVDACRIFKITVSFGSVNSLVELPCALSHASIPSNKRTLPEDLVRISVGIEDVQDLLQDLERALMCAASDVHDVRSVHHSFKALKQDNECLWRAGGENGAGEAKN